MATPEDESPWLAESDIFGTLTGRGGSSSTFRPVADTAGSLRDTLSDWSRERSVGREVVAIVDAKYKRRFDIYNNPDIYQMLAYATALNCPSTFLAFPTSECERDGPVEIINSPVKIEIRRIDISDKGCISAAEDLARSVLGQITKRVTPVFATSSGHN